MGPALRSSLTASLLGLAGAVLACGSLAGCGESSFGPPAAAHDAGADADPDAGLDASDASLSSSLDAAPGCALPGVYGSAACNQCMAERCCAPVTACEADPACHALQRCALDCIGAPDPKLCYDGCLETNADGGALWQPVLDCWSAPSDTLCYGACTRTAG